MSHTETQIEIEPCEKLKDSIDLSYFHDYKISDFKCIKPFQKITINGTYGDINGYRSLKIMLKRCNNLIQNCYNNDYIESIISNSRFVIAYLGYKANFYDKDKKDIENIIYTKGIQLSTIFSKAVFYYMTLAKYQMYDNIFANNKREQTYYLNRDMLLEYLPITKINDNETYNAYSTDNFAYFSFVYDGNVLEYTKKVKKLSEIISYIGNLFNIVYTLFKIINNYFSSKILFVDIFAQFFFEKEYLQKTKPFFENSSLSILPIQKFSSLNAKSLRINSFKKSEHSIAKSKKIEMKLFTDFGINKNAKSKTIEENRQMKEIFYRRNKKNKKNSFNFFKYFKLYYFFPLCVIKNRKNADFLYSIKNSICKTFSLENFLELIKISNNAICKDDLISSGNDLKLSYKKTKN